MTKEHLFTETALIECLSMFITEYQDKYNHNLSDWLIEATSIDTWNAYKDGFQRLDEMYKDTGLYTLVTIQYLIVNFLMDRQPKDDFETYLKMIYLAGNWVVANINNIILKSVQKEN